MRIASDDASQRADYIGVAKGVSVEFRTDAEPSIQWKHIDGPMLSMRSSEVRWLTLWERFQCWIGRADALSLERKYAPDFVSRWEAKRSMQRNVNYWGDRADKFETALRSIANSTCCEGCQEAARAARAALISAK